MRVLVTGATGLVGSNLCRFLAEGGDEVVRVVRRQQAAHSGALVWDTQAGPPDPSSMEGFDAVVHLAGENIAAGRWTRKKKDRILGSRAGVTRALAESLSRLRNPPAVLACASASGVYGDRGAEPLDESSSPACVEEAIGVEEAVKAHGADFLAAVCRLWEDACSPAAARGIRVVNLRFGVILTPAGGALARMLPAFRLGVGGPIGDGGQFMPWVSLDDSLGVIRHALTRGEVRGPVNAVAPQPVTNREFTRTLARVLRRPAVFPLPAWLARAAFGEMADATLLSSARVLPVRLQESGYSFRDPELEGALRSLLGRA